MDDSDRDDADWKNTLIRVYLFVCGRWSSGLCAVAQRQSNNSNPDFTDEEVLTIYLFGLIRKRETIKDIHEYAEDHFRRGSLSGVVSRFALLRWVCSASKPVERRICPADRSGHR